MPPTVWIPLALLVLVTIAGAIHVFFRARTFRRIARSASVEMDEPMRRLERSVEVLTVKMEASEGRTEKLEASVARLQRSLARLGVLRAAIKETADSFNRLTAVYPRK